MEEIERLKALEPGDDAPEVRQAKFKQWKDQLVANPDVFFFELKPE
jgi:hypothetical protein